MPGKCPLPSNPQTINILIESFRQSQPLKDIVIWNSYSSSIIQIFYFSKVIAADYSAPNAIPLPYSTLLIYSSLGFVVSWQIQYAKLYISAQWQSFLSARYISFIFPFPFPFSFPFHIAWSNMRMSFLLASVLFLPVFFTSVLRFSFSFYVKKITHKNVLWSSFMCLMSVCFQWFVNFTSACS